MLREVTFSTNKKIQVVELDHELKRIELKGDGLIYIFTPHATAGLMLNEAESGLIHDFEVWIANNFKGSWKHDRIDNNASAHLASGVLGQSVTIPFKNGKLIRGAWQNLLFVELDGPRSARRVVFQLVKE